MSNPEGQKYCVGCEQWHFEKKWQKYGELMLKGVTDLMPKETERQNNLKQHMFELQQKKHK